MTNYDIILEALKEKHPQSRDDLRKATGMLPNDFNKEINDLFFQGKIVISSAPGPTELGSDPVNVVLDWIDLKEKN